MSARFSLPVGNTYVESDMVIYPNSLLFQAGDYTEEKGVAVSPDDLKQMVQQFQGPLYLNLEHIPSDGDSAGALSALLGVVKNDLGQVQEIWIDPDDPKTLRGKVAVASWLDGELKEKGLSVEIGTDTKSLVGCALTYTPYIEPAALMSAYFAQKNTPHGQTLMQDLHDMTARAGAICKLEGNKKAKMAAKHEVTAFQQIHDLCVEHGAECKEGDKPSWYSHNKPSDNNNQDDGKGKKRMKIPGVDLFKVLFGGKNPEDVEIEIEDGKITKMSDRPAEDKDKNKEDQDSKKIAEMSTLIQSQAATITSLNEQVALLRQDNEVQKADKQYEADCLFIDALARNMRLTGVEVKDYKELAKSKPAAFADMKPVLEKRPPIERLVGREVVDSRKLVDGGTSAMAEAQGRAKDLMEKDKSLASHTAFSRVLKEDPDLARRVDEERNR